MNPLLAKYYNQTMTAEQSELSYPLALEYMKTCSSPLTTFSKIIQSMNGTPTATIKLIKSEMERARKWRDARPTGLNSTVPVTLSNLLNRVHADLEAQIILAASKDGVTLEQLKAKQ